MAMGMARALSSISEVGRLGGAEKNGKLSKSNWQIPLGLQENIAVVRGHVGPQPHGGSTFRHEDVGPRGLEQGFVHLKVGR